MTFEELMTESTRIEAKYADRLGGRALAPMRETLGYVLAQIRKAGVAWDDLDAYVAESIAALRSWDP